ncbi:MAG: 23S rRNA (adenine(2503)-C(2))-methyltransferase RlmN [Candidatus Staskawiczbacteria bacterium]|nr:23S rRNA (adenine(2503)-C(2))-methyltransferase RlmN [Candidatus Staskawiczbacteria bacterium]
MDLSNLEKVLEGEPKYRLNQAREAVYKNFISDWSEATFFSVELREKLNKECPLEIKADVLVSKKEDSVKARITLEDGMMIETVLMRHKDPLRPETSGRNTVCVSSQVGCPLGCLFCATGKMGFKRNLTSEEILEQVIFFSRYLKKITLSEVEGFAISVTNVTYMGMGEPFLNYDNVLDSIRILNDYKYFNIGVRSISVSTAGIIEGIKKLSDDPLHINLAISLHAPNNKLRGELMPINKKYPLAEVLKAVDQYIEKTKRKVMFEYVLIKDVNDSEEHARELAKIMNKKLYFVNLILYNAIPPQRDPALAGQAFEPSTTERVKKFRDILEELKIRYTQRYRFGDDINAACGQFVTSK